MVVVDSSALIPLSWVGHLDLVPAVFDEVRTTREVTDEVLVTGKPGTAALDAFLDDVAVHDAPDDAERVATMEGIATADASVVLFAANADERLLANDRALLAVARSHGVDAWWVTTLLLKCTTEDVVTGDEATEILYDLVDAGLTLHPNVYERVRRRLEELGE